VALSWIEKMRTLPSRTATFASDVRGEMRKVTWPSKKEVYSTTIIVIISVFFFGFYLFLVDSVLQVAVQRVFSMFL
jgi:preprotein translocase subunit SecE